MPRAAVSLQDRMKIRAMDMMADLEVLTLPPELQRVWYPLVSAIIRFGTDGTIDMGRLRRILFGVLFGFPVTASQQGTQMGTDCGTQGETYAETQINMLVREGLLVRSDADHLQLPAKLMPTAREISSKYNGSAGGRPRKNRQVPGQTHLMMGIPGGRSGTPSENLDASSHAGHASARLDPESELDIQGGESPPSGSDPGTREKPKRAVDRDEVARATRVAREAAGFADDRDLPDHTATIRRWLEIGGTSALIERVIVERVAAFARNGDCPLGFGAFNAHVVRAIEEAATPVAQAVDVVPAPAQLAAMPDWMPAAEWNAWLDMRKRQKASPTAHAITLTIHELTKLRKAGHDPAAVLNQSVLNNWKGVFPLRGQAVRKQSRHEAVQNDPFWQSVDEMASALAKDDAA